MKQDACVSHCRYTVIYMFLLVAILNKYLSYLLLFETSLPAKKTILTLKFPLKEIYLHNNPLYSVNNQSVIYRIRTFFLPSPYFLLTNSFSPPCFLRRYGKDKERRKSIQSGYGILTNCRGGAVLGNYYSWSDSITKLASDGFTCVYDVTAKGFLVTRAGTECPLQAGDVIIALDGSSYVGTSAFLAGLYENYEYGGSGAAAVFALSDGRTVTHTGIRAKID